MRKDDEARTAEYLMVTSTHAHKKQQLYLVLSGIFLVNALLAEIIGVKIFSVEKTFGLTGSLSAGVLVWPAPMSSMNTLGAKVCCASPSSR
jgi:hypothetical protein